jgi:RecB family exonuclease
VNALCVVATPLAAARGTRRLCDAQGGILFGPSVATLDRLVPQILAAAGDRRPVLPPLAERLVAVRAGRAAGGAFADLAQDGGLAASLTGALADLRRGEVSAEVARAAAAELAGGPAARLSAVAAALGAFEDALADLGVLDRAGAVRVAAAAAKRGALPAELRELDLLVVDGVASASAAEWDLLAALAARARRTRFHVPFFPERPDACAAAEPLLRRVEALHEVAAQREIEVVLPHVDGDGRAPRLAALLGALGGGRAPREAAGEGLLLAEPGAGEVGEAATAARVLARLLEEGFAPGDVALLSPAPRRAAASLAAACAEAGVPFASGRGSTLSAAPVVALVLEALAAAPGLDRSQAERLAASTYLALPPLPPELGALLDRSGALDGRVTPAGALRRRAEDLTAPAAAKERGVLLRAAEGLDALAALVRPLAGSGTLRAHVARLTAFVDAAGIRRRAGRGPRDVAGRDLAALAALDDALEGLARAVALAGRGAEVLSPAELRALTALALEGASLPPPPEAAAGAVELWGLEEAPGLSARAAVLVGCARGGWPPAAPPDPLLREPERQAVNAALRRAAVPVASARRAEATLRAFSAAAAGREAAAFVWAAPGPAGDGGPLAPLVSDALAALGLEPSAVAPEPALGAARTVREALRAVARDPGRSARALAATGLAVRATQIVERGAIEAARRAAVVRRRASAWAGLVHGPALAVLRRALPQEWSPSQLEDWARCPFRLLLRLGVRLDEPGEEGLDIEVREEGSLLHAVMERFVRERLGRRAWPPAGDAADLAEARAAAAEVFAAFERAGRTGDPAVWVARRETVLARLDRVVRAEAEGPTDVTPALLEHDFGGRSGRPPLELTAGGEVVRLRGRIDRVDAGPSRLLVLDYKSTKGTHAEKLDPEAFGVTSFQIPVYLLAAARELPGRPRLDATYAVLKTAERLRGVELEAGDPGLATTVPAEAAASGGEARPPRPFAAAVVEAVGAVRSGRLAIASRTCAYCVYGAVCRFEGAAARDEEERS